MKKNKAMRLASCLLVLTLLTACMISSAFAKYVTTDTSADTARVAKWGVTAQVSGTLFGKAYNSQTETNGDEIAVTSTNVSSSEKVVAPGTQNSTGLTLSVTGTPEVASKITATTTDNSDIWLGDGDYGVLAKAEGVTAANITDYYVESSGSYEKASAGTPDSSETYYKLIDKTTVSDKYYPIKWALTKKGSGGSDSYTINGKAALYTAINNAFQGTKNAGTPLDTSYTIKWKWEIGSGGTDGADNILGNLISPSADYVVVKTSDNYTNCSKLIETTDYGKDIKVDMTLAVTQVD